MVQVLPAYNPWESVNEAITTGFEAYKHRHDENAIQSALSKLGPNATARETLDALTNTKTYSPQSKQKALENYMGVSKIEELGKQNAANAEYKRIQQQIEESKVKQATDKAQQDKELKQQQLDIQKANNKANLKLRKREVGVKEQKNVIESGKETKKQTQESEKEAVKQGMVDGIDLPEEKKKVLRGAPYGIVEKVFLQQIKPTEAKLTEAEKFYSKELAKELSHIEKEIPQVDADLRTLDKIDKIIDERAESPWQSAIGAFLGSEQATELNALSLPFIKTITHILAPVGPIIKAKMDEAKDKVFIKATDPPWIQRGKSKAIRQMLETSRDILKERKKQIIDSNFSISKEEKDLFDKEAARRINDILITVPPEDLPDPADEKGNIIDTPKGSYYSDGVEWKLKKP